MAEMNAPVIMPCAMRPPNGVSRANSSSKWSGLRSLEASPKSSIDAVVDLELLHCALPDLDRHAARLLRPARYCS